MGFRDIFLLEESVVRKCRRIYNHLVLALAFVFALIFLGAGSLGINLLLPFVGEALGLDHKTHVFLKAGTKIFFVISVVVALLFWISDVLKLVWYYFHNGEQENGRD